MLRQFNSMKTNKPLSGKRILICGKGGSGKSSFVTLMAHALRKADYQVLVLDGDASNPAGLTNLLFGLEKGPEPLLDFFGGRDKVICPADDPVPLTRINDPVPILDKPLTINEIPSEYMIQRNGIVFMQAGKTHRAFEGCDGPMSKIIRDLIISGDHITLIDVEAGIEHFGRGIEQGMDIILIIVDPTYESILIADTVNKLCRELDIEHCWAILNKIESDEIQSTLTEGIQKIGIALLGRVRYDINIFNAALHRRPFGSCEAENDISGLMEKLERLLS